MAFGFYNITIILNDEQEKRLNKLEEKFKQINGWDKQDILQFGMSAMTKNVDISLLFMEMKAEQLDQK